MIPRDEESECDKTSVRAMNAVRFGMMKRKLITMIILVRFRLVAESTWMTLFLEIKEHR